MNQEEKDSSLEALVEIRGIMERSSRFLSLSGWSGIWAGCVALVGAVIARDWLQALNWNNDRFTDQIRMKFVFLGIVIFIAALLGGFYFTMQKAKKQNDQLWNKASRQFIMQLIVPLAAGGVFVLALLNNGDDMYIAPACLLFYGLSLVNGSKYTLSDIRYLGYLEVILGCISLAFPYHGLYFWAGGFGILHILYGIIMWNKYDRKQAEK